jgi:hypothetical protein
MNSFRNLPKKMPHHVKNNRHVFLSTLVIIAVATIGTYLFLSSHAASPYASVEAEDGTTKGLAFIQTGSAYASQQDYTTFSLQNGYASPGGTYADWYFPSNGYSSLEWTVVPIQNPAASLAAAGITHYYAYTFGLTNATSAVGSGYAGFQTDGIFGGKSEDEVINFSIWGSNGGSSPNGFVNADNTRVVVTRSC